MEVLTMVGGAILAPLFTSLLADLRSGDVLNYARKKGVLKQVQQWEETLKTIETVLEKVGEQQRTDESAMWFSDLQNLAYDVEDILDEFNIKAKLESKAGTSKVHKMIRSSFSGLTFESTAEIKDISERLENIKARMIFLKLCTNESKIQVREVGATSLTSSEVNKEDIYGREDDLKSILEQLKVEGGDDVRVRVIPIVGMGGLGKTTLAQLVYNDTSLEFDYKAWVTVGESFDVLTISEAILRQFGGHVPKDLSDLQARLKEKLSNKKALVVLDDVWITNEEYQLWTLFSTPFKAGNPGSKILVTTRNRSVANTTSTTNGYDLKGLSKDVCLSILATHALERKNFNEHPHLRELGRQIAKRCDGLPLAAKALGGILRGKEDTSSWNEVLNSKIWEQGQSVLQALQLSYHHLPSNLKRCFGYTAIFPKDHEFDKTRLVLLWMAEGFVEQIKDGYKYFDELLARSFFQKSSIYESLYVMHDLLNDLARSVSRDFCFNLDEQKVKLCTKVRYSAFTCHEYDIAQRFERFQEMKHLRTFLPLSRGLDYWEDNYLSPTVLDFVINKLKYLRVLALPYAIKELPISIDCLKHLRYLDLSHTRIYELPKSLCKLFNLEALILFKCSLLQELPKDFCNLINLQFLDIRGTFMKKNPLHIGYLKNLHILGEFIVGCWWQARSCESPDFHGPKRISALENVTNFEDMDCWDMRHIKLEWHERLDDSFQLQNDLSHYTSLEIFDCPNLESFSEMTPLIPSLLFLNLGVCEKLRSLPNHFNQFTSLQTLIINKCPQLASFPEGGLPTSLKDLRIFYCEKLERKVLLEQSLNALTCLERLLIYVTRGVDDINTFPNDSLLLPTSLTFLNIVGFRNLKSISTGIQRLTSLETLEIRECPRLQSLPRVASLGHLEIWECPILEKQCRKKKGDFWLFVSSIPLLVINGFD